ncbi:MAG: hypothetical protein AAGI89_05295 [Pseudomonadota bacterium]
MRVVGFVFGWISSMMLSVLATAAIVWGAVDLSRIADRTIPAVTETYLLAAAPLPLGLGLLLIAWLVNPSFHLAGTILRPVVAWPVSIVLIAGSIASVMTAFVTGLTFPPTPRLDAIKSLKEIGPDVPRPYYAFMLERFPEANLVVNLELCGIDASEVHQSAIATHVDNAVDDESAEAWLEGYVQAVSIIEDQQRYNLGSGSISSKASHCNNVMRDFETWRETQR